MKTWVVGSRKSQLALTQTNWVIDRLREADSEVEFELEKIVTKGDRILDVTLSKVGGKGLFVKEIEQALLTKEIDMAIHSLKDLPSVMTEGTILGAVPVREDVRDVLLSKDGVTLEELPSGAIVGTSSLRRQAQILAVRPDLRVESIRGNVDTRIQKMKDGSFDAIILAAAGLKRLSMQDQIVEYLAPATMLPAVGQGALAVQIRENEPELLSLLQQIHCEKTYLAVEAERAFLHTIEGGCHLPIAAYAQILEDGQVSLTALVGDPSGEKMISDTLIGEDASELGKTMAQHLIDRGAKHLLSQV
ncbi:hydroxymethylbilane synthase [Risungbinella massiliensis]|uniref:hydroxymethylbilane synthase n=1 Tax=Risungbinella massiliensis TaxID=1329796 RepID=UPI0005CBDBEC|nr:hydroxymethylbilane synthase [Risungbinella massiliensis]